MRTIHQTCDRTSDHNRHHVRDCRQDHYHLPNLCLFVLMFAKAQCACRKRRPLNELRPEPQWRALCPGHKKTLKIRGGRVGARSGFIHSFTSAITHFAALCALFLRRGFGGSIFHSFSNLRRFAVNQRDRPRAKALMPAPKPQPAARPWREG